MNEPTALDVVKELATLAGKALLYTACIGGFSIFILWLTAGIHEAIRIMK